jgi:hypothetical protein
LQKDTEDHLPSGLLSKSGKSTAHRATTVASEIEDSQRQNQFQKITDIKKAKAQANMAKRTRDSSLDTQTTKSAQVLKQIVRETMNEDTSGATNSVLVNHKISGVALGIHYEPTEFNCYREDTTQLAPGFTGQESFVHYAVSP